MHDSGANRRQVPRPPDESLIAVVSSQRHVRQPRARPFDAAIRRDHRRGAFQHDLTLTVGADRVEHDDAFLWLLFLHRDGGGDRVAGRNRLEELEVLAEIDRAWSGQARAEHGRDEGGRPHAMGDDMAEETGFRKGSVEMGRVLVTGNGGEQIDVVAPDQPNDRGGVAGLQLVEGSVAEKFVHQRFTFAKHSCLGI
ncbi:hypothetical protein D3C72_1471320 [compost metagenome]